MMVIGFQEIVALTAQQIVQTDPEKRSVLWPVDFTAANICFVQEELGKAHN